MVIFGAVDKVRHHDLRHKEEIHQQDNNSCRSRNETDEDGFANLPLRLIDLDKRLFAKGIGLIIVCRFFCGRLFLRLRRCGGLWFYFFRLFYFFFWLRFLFRFRILHFRPVFGFEIVNSIDICPLTALFGGNLSGKFTHKVFLCHENSLQAVS